MKEAEFYTKEENDTVLCELCALYCRIHPGERGRCKIRENREGTLYTLAVDNVASFTFGCIEDAPFHHFWPGSRTLELSTVGCNLSCKFCCSWSISQAGPGEVREDILKPEQIIDAALNMDARAVLYTHTEPTVSYEYVHEIAKLAKENRLLNAIVTNGYMTKKAWDGIAPLIDAVNVTPKGFTDEFYKKVCGVPGIKPVLDFTRAVQESGTHLEATYILIPGENDDRASISGLSEFLAGLDTKIPLNLIRYFPSYEMAELETTDEGDLNSARELAMDSGLKYVYVGNTYLNPYKNTYCPSCSHLLIERVGLRIVSYEVKEGKCPECQEPIPITGELITPTPPF